MSERGHYRRGPPARRGVAQAPAPVTMLTDEADGSRLVDRGRLPEVRRWDPAHRAREPDARHPRDRQPPCRSAECRRSSFKKLGPPTADYYQDATATVSLADPELISAYFETEEYSGGAHPNQYYAGVHLRDRPRPPHGGDPSGPLPLRRRRAETASDLRDGPPAERPGRDVRPGRYCEIDRFQRHPRRPAGRSHGVHRHAARNCVPAPALRGGRIRQRLVRRQNPVSSSLADGSIRRAPCIQSSRNEDPHAPRDAPERHRNPGRWFTPGREDRHERNRHAGRQSERG